MTKRDKEVDAAQLKVLFTVPFFASGVARLPVKFTDQIPTACTNGDRILWNPGFWDFCEPQQRITVYCEEVGHALLGHLWRAPLNADWQVWNQACDHAVRLMMQEFGEARVKAGHPDPFPFPMPEQCLPDKRFAGMNEEKIYRLLMDEQDKNQKKQPKPQDGSGDGEGNDGPQGNKPGKGKGGGGKAPPQKGASGDKELPKRDNGSRMLGEMEKPGNKPDDAKAQEQKANSWKNTLIQSAIMAKGQGFIPAGMERLIDSLVSPQVPWTELLRNFLREKAKDDWDWMKPDQLFEGSGFMLPSLNSERLGPMVFATDTSGSIDNETLRQFQSEKQYCLDDLKPSKLVDIYCDAAIHKEKEYRPGDQIELDAPGGGGTDFRPVFDLCEQMHPSPKCVVCLTDLMGTFPDKEPPYEVLWVVWQKGATAPFGQVIEV